MERLTGREENGHAYAIDCPPFLVPKEANLILQNAVDRLAAFEDTDLEPDQIAETLWRLRDYFDADREGRLIVLPCEDRKGMENLANRIERMVVRDDYAVGVSGAEKRIAYAITSALRSEK